MSESCNTVRTTDVKKKKQVSQKRSCNQSLTKVREGDSVGGSLDCGQSMEVVRI